MAEEHEHGRERYFDLLFRYLESECFPKTCRVCKRVYHTDLEYTLETEQIGDTMHHVDKQLNQGHGLVLFLRNCKCGGTLACTIENIALFGKGEEDFVSFLKYIGDRAKREGKTNTGVFNEFRDEYNGWLIKRKEVKKTST